MKKNQAKIFLTLLLFSFCFSALAQLTDLARLEYSFIPKGNSEDQYTRLRALLNFPLKTSEDCYLIIGGEYNRIILNLEDNYPFDKDPLRTLNIIDFNLGYTFKLNQNWRIGAKITPRIASTLNNKITHEDLFLNGGVYAIKDRTDATDIKRPYRLILGLTYNTTTGLPFPLPFVNYFRQVNKNWSLSLGVPKSNVTYYFNDKHSIETFVGLDGYFAHLQKPTMVLGKQVDNISLSIAVIGIGYDYNFSKHLVGYSYIGHTFMMNNVLRNQDREDVFTLDDTNTFYLRTGIKFKI
ncbi:hypothetical protein C7H62_1816 [Mesoflavibacter sp. HG96]|uniref:DUF6268 family outer membrane beta-barrel protein n=1 Tax=Mesoflavibacter profundi TaxID=2708110 RepID=A0ABT4RVX9_9FLAO|nr:MULTISPECIES: DUF6268 family outer membrane beta-barrel protein [Mesoflavibacter]MDA0175995.1 DUF6268 family outer membrane beta-barrel protein [Mesoflavibacter profundi]QIJ89625.1 hypothetical protein C7H62_1816 [Mesoflavibacter sp. HG96]